MLRKPTKITSNFGGKALRKLEFLQGNTDDVTKTERSSSLLLSVSLVNLGNPFFQYTKYFPAESYLNTFANVGRYVASVFLLSFLCPSKKDFYLCSFFSSRVTTPVVLIKALGKRSRRQVLLLRQYRESAVTLCDMTACHLQYQQCS